MPTFGSLFAGIGGIDLGLERAGWDCRFQVEWDPFCQRVLAKHWPDVPRFGDIHDVHGRDACPVLADAVVSPDKFGIAQSSERPLATGDGEATCGGCLPEVDLLAGGFPCQPFSVAGRRKGIEDDRWLWPEFARAIGELRPKFVLVENVPGLLAGGGMGAVLGGLAELGYDAEWDSVPAAAVGAPHLRYRVWIVGYRRELRTLERVSDAFHDFVRDERERDQASERTDGWPAIAGHDGADWSLADPDEPGPQGHRGLDRERDGAGEWSLGSSGWPVNGQWLTEPDVGRVAHGVPSRVDRLRALGNAVVPQVVEVIGRALLERAA